MSSGMLSHPEARRIVRKLNLKSLEEWRDFSKSGDRPANIPGNPAKFYRNKGWISYMDWMGYDLKDTKYNKMLPFEEAREYVRELGLTSQKTYFVWSTSGKRPKNIPGSPHETYKGKGWVSYPDWMGYKPKKVPGQMLPFKQARAIVRKLRLKGRNEWRNWSMSGQRPCNIPGNPRETYKGKGWVSFPDWIGTHAIMDGIEHKRKQSATDSDSGIKEAKQPSSKRRATERAVARGKTEPSAASAPPRYHRHLTVSGAVVSGGASASVVQVGDKVEALWAANRRYYDATVLATAGNKLDVVFDLDGVVLRGVTKYRAHRTAASIAAAKAAAAKARAAQARAARAAEAKAAKAALAEKQAEIARVAAEKAAERKAKAAKAKAARAKAALEAARALAECNKLFARDGDDAIAGLLSLPGSASSSASSSMPPSPTSSAARQESDATAQAGVCSMVATTFKGSFFCTMPGCNKSYTSKNSLARHIATTHAGVRLGALDPAGLWLVGKKTHDGPIGAPRHAAAAARLHRAS